MKKLFIVLLSFAFVSAQAQTVDEIIQKYSAAMGGLDAFNKVTSAKITGTVTTQGMDLPLTTQIINNKAMRTDVEVMGQSIVNVYNNGKGWKINPFAGAPSTTDVTGTELTDLRAQSSLTTPLMDYKKRGHQVELSGQEDIEGIKVFRIKLVNKDDGKLITYFIDAADYLLIKSVTKKELQGQELDVETYYSDIKEINGLKFSMRRTQKIEGQEFQSVKFTTIELNVPVDEKIFDK